MYTVQTAHEDADGIELEATHLVRWIICLQFMSPGSFCRAEYSDDRSFYQVYEITTEKQSIQAMARVFLNVLD